MWLFMLCHSLRFSLWWNPSASFYHCYFFLFGFALKTFLLKCPMENNFSLSPNDALKVKYSLIDGRNNGPHRTCDYPCHALVCFLLFDRITLHHSTITIFSSGFPVKIFLLKCPMEVHLKWLQDKHEQLNFFIAF